MLITCFIQSEEKDESVWASALSCLLYFVCDRGKIWRNRLVGLDIRVRNILLSYLILPVFHGNYILLSKKTSKTLIINIFQSKVEKIKSVTEGEIEPLSNIFLNQEVVPLLLELRTRTSVRGFVSNVFSGCIARRTFH